MRPPSPRASARTALRRRGGRSTARCPRPTSRATARRPAASRRRRARCRAPAAAQLAVDRDARARHRLLVEVLGHEARLARARHAAHRQAERRLARDPVRAELDRARGEAAGGEDEPARVVSVTSWPAASRADRRDARAVALGADDRVAEHEPPARVAQRRAQQIANTRMPGTDGGSVGISNTGRPRRCLEVGPGARAGRAGRAPPGSATRSSPRRRERDAAREAARGRPGRRSAARGRARWRRRALELELDLDRARRDPGAPRGCRRSSAGMEVAQRARCRRRRPGRAPAAGRRRPSSRARAPRAAARRRRWAAGGCARGCRRSGSRAAARLRPCRRTTRARARRRRRRRSA